MLPAARSFIHARRSIGLHPNLLLLHAEQTEVDRLGHGLVARVIGVKVIAFVVLFADEFGLGRIPRYRVEVDHAVESSTPDERIERLAFRLLLLAVIAVQRRASFRAIR